MYEPLPFPFCDDKLPDNVMVSLVVIGASIDWDIDMPDTSIVGKERSLQIKEQPSILMLIWIVENRLTRIRHRTD